MTEDESEDRDIEHWRAQQAQMDTESMLASQNLQELAAQLIAEPQMKSLLAGMHIAIAEATPHNSSFLPDKYAGLLQFYPLVKTLAEVHKRVLQQNSNNKPRKETTHV